jgi:glycosyltransferase involved in cell wall biosynthesis
MRILHIYKDYYPVLGGMENHIKALAEEQVRRGLDLTVLVTSRTGRTTIDHMNGVRVIRAARLATVASTPISTALPILLRRERPDIAHLHFPYPVGELSQLLFGHARKMVITYHSDVIKQKYILRFYKPFLKKALSSADRIIATSDRYVESSPYLKPLRDKCVVIPLGVDPTPFLNFDPTESRRIRDLYGTPLILFVGRLRYYKGLQYLIKAMKDVSARLLVVGGGPMEAEWQTLAGSLDLGNKITFRGEVEDDELPALYHACDLFVLPASERSEAFGLVQVEAMMSGKPVVSTELGTGTSFVNLHGRTGYVVTPRDENTLADAINDLLADEPLRQKMGDFARQRALKEFSLTTMVDRTIDLYQSLYSS